MIKNLEMQLKELHKAVMSLREEVKTCRKLIEESRDTILTEAKVLELLDVGEKTLRSYRTNGLIAYSKIGNKFFYKMSDIETMINKARIEAD